ncbi:hypothetical protein C0993_005126 [Termitomyces sp. T159_Od127]|nr:hypothetical protein C0993_005126 [Termitomyces sp. T159_Od127]
MYGVSVIKQPRGGPNGPPGTYREPQTNASPTRPIPGKRKKRDIDVFGQQADQEPRTPTRPRTRTETVSDSETETHTTAESEAIVLNQLENMNRELQHFSDHHVWGTRIIELAYKVAKKFLPELVEAGEKERDDGNADSSRALQETAELRSTVRDLAKAVKNLVERQEATPKQNGENQRGPQEFQGVKTVTATGPIYRPVKTITNNARPTAQTQQFQPRSPKDQYHPARLIVIPRGERIDSLNMNPRKIVTLINDRLSQSEHAKHLCVASAHYNYNQNLVIMMRADQRGEELRQHAEEFIDIFGVPAHTIEMITDDRRYKVRINGVWTGRKEENGVYTPEELMEEIKRFNPVMAKVELMGKPRWMRAETDLRLKDYSSVVLEFAKEEDAKTIIAEKQTAGSTMQQLLDVRASRLPVQKPHKMPDLRREPQREGTQTKRRTANGRRKRRARGRKKGEKKYNKVRKLRRRTHGNGKELP